MSTQRHFHILRCKKTNINNHQQKKNDLLKGDSYPSVILLHKKISQRHLLAIGPISFAKKQDERKQ